MVRKIDILVLSDLHLGTNQCRAKRLLKYLKSVKPQMLILNGDIIDIWLFNLKKWPKIHTKILVYFFNLLVEDIPIYYLPGNHDDYLKQFSGFKFHNFEIRNELTLNLNGSYTWFMHGDKNDKSITGKRRKIAIKAGKAFDKLVGLNRAINEWENFLGKKEAFNFSKTLKDKTKTAIKKDNDFEQQYINEAALNGVDDLICGHMHRPGIHLLCDMKTKKEVRYLNSGDWTENCTALEYIDGEWKLYQYNNEDIKHVATLKSVQFNQEDINLYKK